MTPTAFDELLDRATHRLRVDAELRLEVRGELQSHLSAAADEYRAAGLSDADATAAAARDFGDADGLADQLWAANRRRVRARNVARWAVRLGAGPVAVVAAVACSWSAIVSLSLLTGLAAIMGTDRRPPVGAPPGTARTTPSFARCSRAPERRIVAKPRVGNGACRGGSLLSRRACSPRRGANGAGEGGGVPSSGTCSLGIFGSSVGPRSSRRASSPAKPVIQTIGMLRSRPRTPRDWRCPYRLNVSRYSAFHASRTFRASR